MHINIRNDMICENNENNDALSVIMKIIMKICRNSNVNNQAAMSLAIMPVCALVKMASLVMKVAGVMACSALSQRMSSDNVLMASSTWRK
jgi:hypothetical protein